MSDLVLVTGGAGYVGSIVVDELLGRGYRVRAIDSLLHGGVPSLLLAWGDRGFEFARVDIRDDAAVEDALQGVQAVVHLAAVVGDPACAVQPDLAREVNVEATRRLLGRADALGVERFIFASTCSNYGKLSSDDFATEDIELRPVSLYAETKVEAEGEILGNSRRLAATSLRFATVYGTSPRMRFDLTVNEFTRDVALDRDLVVYGEQFWRPYVHVRDAAVAVAQTLEAPVETVAGNVYNVGDTKENYRKVDIVALLHSRFPKAKVDFVHRDEDPRDYRVSFEKIATELKFKPQRTVSDGIDEVASLVTSGLLQDPYAPVYKN